MVSGFETFYYLYLGFFVKWFDLHFFQEKVGIKFTNIINKWKISFIKFVQKIILTHSCELDY